MNGLTHRHSVAALIVTLMLSACASAPRAPKEGAVSGGIQSSQQAEFNSLVLKQRTQIIELQKDVESLRRQVAKLARTRAGR